MSNYGAFRAYSGSWEFAGWFLCSFSRLRPGLRRGCRCSAWRPLGSIAEQSRSCLFAAFLLVWCGGLPWRICRLRAWLWIVPQAALNPWFPKKDLSFHCWHRNRACLWPPNSIWELHHLSTLLSCQINCCFISSVFAEIVWVCGCLGTLMPALA